LQVEAKAMAGLLLLMVACSSTCRAMQGLLASCWSAIKGNLFVPSCAFEGGG
jgi:hypothetical protein